MIEIKLKSFNGQEFKKPATVYGWCSFRQEGITHVFVQVCWAWNKEELKISQHEKNDNSLSAEIFKLINEGRKEKVRPNEFAVSVDKISCTSHEEWKKCIEKEVQNTLNELLGK